MTFFPDYPLDIDIDSVDDKDPIWPVGKCAGTPVSKLDRGYLGWFLAKYDAGSMDSGRVVDFMNIHIDLLRDLVEGAQIRLADADVDVYQLSPSQQECSNGIIAAFDAGQTFIRLEGGAGYGKSFAVRDIVRALLRSRKYYIQATAVSYVATQVLKGQLDRYGIDCGTLARTLKMDKTFDGPNEVYGLSMESHGAMRELFEPRGDKRSMLIIDEYSMINDDYAKFMGKAAKQHGGCILVVGDLKQLPPVKQDTDTIFASIPTAFNLTDPMRYSRESGLYLVEQMVRNDPHAALNDLALVANKHPEDVFVHANKTALFEDFKRVCQEFPHQDNRILFYKRQDVVDANNAVRQVLFGEDAPALMPGERLMIVRTSDYNEFRYYTGDTLDVIDVDIQSVSRTLDPILLYDDRPLTNTRMQARLGNGEVINILFAINDTKADPDAPGGAAFNATSTELRIAALRKIEEGESPAAAWKPYRDFRNSFIFVAYSYATTVHKSQGATVDRIYVTPSELLSIPKVGKNLTYVALTRAKQELHVS